MVRRRNCRERVNVENAIAYANEITQRHSILSKNSCRNKILEQVLYTVQEIIFSLPFMTKRSARCKHAAAHPKLVHMLFYLHLTGFGVYNNKTNKQTI